MVLGIYQNFYCLMLESDSLCCELPVMRRALPQGSEEHSSSPVGSPYNAKLSHHCRNGLRNTRNGNQAASLQTNIHRRATAIV